MEIKNKVKAKVGKAGEALLRELEKLSEEEFDEILSRLGFSIEDSKGNILDVENKIMMLVNLGEKKIEKLIEEIKNNKNRGKAKNKPAKKRDNAKDKKLNKKELVKEVEKEGDGEEAEDEEAGEEVDVDIGNAEEEVKKLRNVLTGDDIVIDKVEIKGSKPISQIKKGDRIKVDGVEFQVDAQYVLIDHGKTREMAIEIFNPKTDRDYQLRYFVDQIETSMEFYELQEIVYVRRPVKKVEW